MLRKILLGLIGLVALAYAGLIIYAYWPGEPEVPIAQLASPDDRFVNVDGINLRYRTYGTEAPDRPTLVLIHGFANSLQTWRLLAPLLANDYYVVAFDVPGFGLSDKPVDHNYGNESQAAVIIGMIRALKLKNVIIGGHSMGGTLAVNVAAQDPDLIGMALFNPGLITTGVPAITEYLFFPMPRLSAKMFGDSKFRESFLRNSFVNQDIVTDAVVNDLSLASRSEGYLEGTTELMSYYVSGHEVDLLKDIRIPTLLCWGNEDHNKLPDEAEQLQAMIAGSRVVRVPGAGHYVHEEKPDICAKALIDAKDFWAAHT